jgi:hypothetical protein
MPTTGERFERAVSIMARLRGPGGCPWDREQTFDSIKPYTVEETYEVLEAIDNRDWDELTGESAICCCRFCSMPRWPRTRALFRSTRCWTGFPTSWWTGIRTFLEM